MIENVTIVDANALRELLAKNVFVERYILKVADELATFKTEPYFGVVSNGLKRVAHQQMRARAGILTSTKE